MNRARILVCLCVIVTVFVCLVTLTLHSGNQSDVWRLLGAYKNITNVVSTSISAQPARISSSQTILLWTTFFGKPDYLPSLKEEQCEFQDCIITSNKSLLNQSGIIVFHFLDTNAANLPKFRNPSQAWALFLLESPINSGSLEQYNDVFNWTATYRMDSDVWTPYGHFRKLNGSEASRVKLKNYATGKTKPVAWFTSNCHTSGNREEFVSELQKTVSVDIYGSCGTMECSPKMSFECYHKAARQYFFYLSFENSICKDYVTEKFFHILQTDMVPVVFGGGNYKAIAPPNSFIDALSFKTPKDLGNYLKLVSQNETLYNSYFSWRSTHGFGGYHWVCKLCAQLKAMSSGGVKHKVYNDLQSWWKSGSKCVSWTPKGMQGVP